jgi:hypothetical protein
LRARSGCEADTFAKHFLFCSPIETPQRIDVKNENAIMNHYSILLHFRDGERTSMKVMEIAGDWGLDHLAPGSRPDHGPPGFGQVLVHMQAASIGADEIINYTAEPRWESRALEIAGRDGIDLVIDLAGSLDQSVKAVRTGGFVATIGVLAGPSATVPLGQIVTRAIRLQGVTAGSRRSFEVMVRAIQRHRLRPVLSVAGNSMEDAPKAIAAITEGKHFGKLCIHLRGQTP